MLEESFREYIGLESQYYKQICELANAVVVLFSYHSVFLNFKFGSL